MNPTVMDGNSYGRFHVSNINTYYNNGHLI